MSTRSYGTRLFALAMVTTLSLAACSPGAEPQTSPTADPTDGQETTQEVPPKPDFLTINVFSGAFQANMEEYVVKPFQEETGITVNLVSSAPPLSTLQAQGDNPEIDLFIAGDPQRLLAEQQDLLQPYDPAVVTNAADLFEPARMSDSALVLNYASQGLVYNTEKLSEAPTSWFDLFDLDLPGQIVVRAPDAQNTVSWLTLMAYELNGEWPDSIDDYDEVLRRVKEDLSPNLFAAVSSSGDVLTAMVQQEVTLTVWQDSQVLAANAGGATLAYAEPAEGPLPVATMVALTNTQNKYWAEVLMNYMLDPVGQAGWAENGGYGPSNSVTQIDEELAEQITYGEEAVSRLVKLPWEKIIPLSTDLIEEFNAAISN